LKFHRERDIKLYKKQRNKVNNMKKIAKENFENNLDHILLENSLFRIVIIFVGIHSCAIFRKHFVNFSHISSTSFKWSSFSFQLISFNFKTVLKFHRERDIKLYKKQRNKVNNMKKIAKENFENNLDHILLENSSNPKTYWKIFYIKVWKRHVLLLQLRYKTKVFI
jgi:CO dehydrogenase/acetyl-CoA synthase gamma subunit (corrinoid Fe-S protein)